MVVFVKIFLCDVLGNFIVKYCNLDFFVVCVCKMLCNLLVVGWFVLDVMVFKLNVVEVMMCWCLKFEGYMYQFIKDDLWCDIVIGQLQDMCCIIVDIVVVVGFVELSVFYCVFCKWMGMWLMDYWLVSVD